MPSWFFSLLFHAAVLFALWTWFRDWQSGAGGLGEGFSTEFSMLSGEANPSGFTIQMDAPREESTGENAETSETVAATQDPSHAEIQTTAVLPTTAELSLPTASGLLKEPVTPAVVGGGAGDVPSDARNFIRGGKGTGNTGPPGGGGIGGTSFMGISDRATRVVYAIDSSGSMMNNHAMQAAKGALVASLQSLSESQQFQVIFFEDHARVLRITNDSNVTLPFATSINKSKALQEIAAVVPGDGTNRLEAIQLAMRFGPEVIYLLTDADDIDPGLNAAELERIKKANKGRARIHCIEFGKGAKLDGTPLNFLQKLARQNGGNYTYLDVKRLR